MERSAVHPAMRGTDDALMVDQGRAPPFTTDRLLGYGNKQSINYSYIYHNKNQIDILPRFPNYSPKNYHPCSRVTYLQTKDPTPIMQGWLSTRYSGPEWVLVFFHGCRGFGSWNGAPRGPASLHPYFTWDPDSIDIAARRFHSSSFRKDAVSD